MLNVPNQVWQKDQKRDCASGENPWRKQDPALARQKNAGDQCRGEDYYRILVLEPDSSDSTEHQPQFRISCFDESQHRERQATPKQRLETIHRELMIDDPPHTGCRCERGSENGTETSCTKLAREC